MSKSGCGKLDIENKDLNGILYYIRFFNKNVEFWKIGITAKTITERFDNKKLFYQKHNLYYDVILEKHLHIKECYTLEQNILEKYKKNRIKIEYNGFNTTEAFSTNVLKDFYDN